MDRIERNYRALLAVTVVLQLQRGVASLWDAITVEVTKVVPWARATVTLYDPDVDGFRFYVVVIRLHNLFRVLTSRCLERFAAQQPERLHGHLLVIRFWE